MKDDLTSVIGHLKSLSSADLSVEFAKYKDSDIARTLAHIEAANEADENEFPNVFATLVKK